MQKIARLSAIAAAIVLAPAGAYANSSTTHVAGIIPVRCELGASNAGLHGQGVEASYNLYCNTPHALVIDVNPATLSGGAEIEIDGRTAPFNGHAELHVGYGALERHGHIQIRLASPTEASIAGLAQSLQISVRTN